jgi:endo-1,4-beta-xylanase
MKLKGILRICTFTSALNANSIRKTNLWLRLFSIVLVLFLALNMTYVLAQAAPTGQRLRALAGSFLIGYASRNNFWSMSDAAQYQEVARTEFNFMTPENAMKWDATEPSQNNFTFSQADQHVAFALNNNMKIHGHTLVWHSQLPSWVANGSWNSTTLTNVMYNHIDTVMNHWTDGQIAVWDVVNEAFNEDGSRRSSVFQNVIGNSYIELAFQRARAADSQTKLVYNDYNVETINSKSNAMYNMVADFKNRGVPIDGVGLQMHLAGSIDYNSLAQNMQRFANLGVEIYITEMDVRYPTPISQANLQAQATVYSNVLARCRAQPACKALQVWGIPDKYSWVPDVFPGTGAPLLFDDNYNAKPAYYAVQSGLSGTTNTPTFQPPTNTPGPSSPTPTRTFTPTPGGVTYYRLVARHSGKVAGVAGASTANGARVVQWSSNGSTDQQWQFQSVGSGYYNVINRNSGKCLDVSGASTANGAVIQQWTCGSGTNQRWRMQDMGGGYIQLIAQHSNKCLDVSGASTANGATIQQWTCGSGTNQQWQRQ